jgi:hypothetical protein
MAIQGSGQIKLTELATEFGGTAPYSLKAYYRSGGRVPTNNTNVPTSGAIGLKNFYNAVNRVTAVQTYSTNTTQTTLNVSTLSGYVAGITDVTVYVSSNVYVYSTDTATPALTISGATAGDVITLVNNGFIIGKGGDGASGVLAASVQTNGGAAGPAMSLGYNINITNNSYIAGGGGGGAACGYPASGAGGGGAGGGNGGSIGGVYIGGTGGAPGQPGSAGYSNQGNFPNYGGGGGGGRVLPGTGSAGSVFSTKPQGAGAGAGGTASGGSYAGSGGPGGSAGDAAPDTGDRTAAGGGGWGAKGGNVGQSGIGGLVGGPGFGGAGGKAIALNGFTVTYITTGTVYGAVS